jgi:hypothetical protein
MTTLIAHQLRIRRLQRLKQIKYPEAIAGAGRLEENFSYDLIGNLINLHVQGPK